MTQEELEQQLVDLEKKIAAAKPGKRHLFQPDLHRLVEEMVVTGHEITPRIRDLDEELTNDAIEAQFDNLPV